MPACGDMTISYGLKWFGLVFFQLQFIPQYYSWETIAHHVLKNKLV